MHKNIKTKSKYDGLKDIPTQNISLSVPNKVLLDNTDFKLSYGKRYGLIGHNGLGKSTLLKHIADRKIVVPENLDIFYVEQEVVSDPDKTVFQHIVESNSAKQQLVNRLEYLIALDDDNDDDNSIMDEINEIEEKLTAMGVDKDESIIRKILYGLGFEKEDQDKPTSEFSGGWRMRMSLAKALYLKPSILLLDEPNNHLDLNAMIWLTDYLSTKWSNTLVVVSHDKNFLNEVSTHTIHLENKKLTYYKGNYDAFHKSYLQNLTAVEKEWDKIQKKIMEMKKKRVSKKDVDEFIQDITKLRPPKPYTVRIMFKDHRYRYINYSPLLMLNDVSFGYSSDPDSILYNNVNLGLQSGDRITIVGKNGVGKSTLIKLMMGTVKPLSGEIKKDERVRIGYYNQHSVDALSYNLCAIEHIQSIDPNLDNQNIRKCLGMIGLEGSTHTQPIVTLSGGQKARLMFVSLFVMKPHIMLLDEPTNHLDIETIDALIDSINIFDGAIVTITHNIELIEKTNTVLYEISDKSLNKIDFDDYYKKIVDEL